MMKHKNVWAVLFALFCGFALLSCGGGGGGGSRGAAQGEPDEQEPSMGGESEAAARYLLPENVLSADFDVFGQEVTLNLHIDEVSVGEKGHVWQAKLSGKALFTGDAYVEREGEASREFSIVECTITQQGEEGIVLNVMDGQSVFSSEEGVMKVAGMRVEFHAQSENGREGKIEDVDVARFIYWEENELLGQQQSTNLESALRGARFVLRDFVTH